MNIYAMTADFVETNTNTSESILKGLDEATDRKKIKKIIKASRNYCRETLKTCDLYESFVHEVPNVEVKKELLKAIYKQRSLVMKLRQVLDKKEKGVKAWHNMNH